MLHAPLAHFGNAIRRPSGDQLGRYMAASSRVVIEMTFEPSAFMTRSSLYPSSPLRLTNAMLVPSGDHAGYAAAVAIRTGAEPSSSTLSRYNSQRYMQSSAVTASRRPS